MPLVVRLWASIAVQLVVVVNTAPASPGPAVTVPTEFPTIQSAIDAAADDTTIRVKPGSYRETLALRGRTLILQSTDGPDATLIDAQGSDSVVSITDGASVTIQGFTLRNGQAARSPEQPSSGGGVLVDARSGTVVNVVLRGNVITDNLADYGGGLSAVAESSSAVTLLLDGNLFTQNEATRSGGGLAVNADTEATITVTSRNNHFELNTRGNCGSEMFLNPVAESATVRFQSSSDEIRSADRTGTQELCGYAIRGHLDVEMTDALLHVPVGGIGAWVSGVNGARIRLAFLNSRAIGIMGPGVLDFANTALYSDADSDSEMTVELEDSSIIGAGRPEVLGLPGAPAVTLNSSGRASVLLRQNSLRGNFGPVARVSNHGTMNLVVAANAAVQNYGGLQVENTGTLTAFFTNNLVADNEMDALRVYDQGTGELRFVNNTVTGNRGAAAFFVSSAGQTSAVITNSILFGNDGDDFYSDGNLAEVTISRSNVGTTFGRFTDGGGNFSADPRFQNPTGQDYSLMPDSPCIDAGTSENAPADDLEGHMRPFGTAVDIGAFEFGYATPTPTATDTPPATRTPSATSTAIPTNTARPSSTPDSTATPTIRPTETPPITPCIGDCNGDGRVTIGELVLSVGMALDRRSAQCAAVDRDGSGSVTVDELVAAVGSALAGCASR